MMRSSTPTPWRQLVSSLDRWVRPIVDLRRVAFAAQGYAYYWRDWRAYADLPGSEPLHVEEAYPCLFDRTASTSFDAHYFYQSVWAAQCIALRRPALHIDVGSLAFFVGMLTAVTQVAFLDIRPVVAAVEDFQPLDASLLGLPFAADTVQSLSCLHVAEHVGLGRYGDPLDPYGTSKAARELARVLAPGGDLYFSLPVGEPRVAFNAHRIHSVHGRNRLYTETAEKTDEPLLNPLFLCHLCTVIFYGLLRRNRFWVTSTACHFSSSASSPTAATFSRTCRQHAPRASVTPAVSFVSPSDYTDSQPGE